jgi:hypothetical protein
MSEPDRVKVKLMVEAEVDRQGSVYPDELAMHALTSMLFKASDRLPYSEHGWVYRCKEGEVAFKNPVVMEDE